MTILLSVTRAPYPLGPTVAVLLVLSGCSAQIEPKTAAVAEQTAPAAAPVEKRAEKDLPAVVPDTNNELNNEKEEELEPVEDLSQAIDSFEPPFPDRVELFVAPKRQGSGNNKLAGGEGSAVELLGFVNVDGKRVVLSIDGFVSPLAEGSQYAGIEVISIQPPAVVLQRGRQRWQVKLQY